MSNIVTAPPGIFMDDGNKPVAHGYGLNTATGTDLHSSAIGVWPNWEGSGSGVADIAQVALGMSGILTDGASFLDESERGRVLDFDGADDHVLTSNRTHITEFTLACWAKWPNWTSGNNYTHLISRGNVFANDTNYAFGTRIHPTTASSRRFYLYVRNGATLGGFETAQMDVLFPAGVWYHMVATWSSARQEQFIYVNGVEVGSDTDVRVPGNIAADLRIGGPNATDTTSEFFLGQLDTPMIFDRVLAPAETKELHDNPYALITPPSNVAIFVPPVAPAGTILPHMMHMVA